MWLCQGNWYIYPSNRIAQTKLNFVEGQGRDPFPFVSQNAAMEDNDKQWLHLGHSNWEFGDNVSYPGNALFIRKVNRHMKDFIFKHFEEDLAASATSVISKIHFCLKMVRFFLYL